MAYLLYKSVICPEYGQSYGNNTTLASNSCIFYEELDNSTLENNNDIWQNKWCANWVFYYSSR